MSGGDAEQDPLMTWRLETRDDGSTVDLESVTGGAASEGAWGKLTLRFTDPDGRETLRTYVGGEFRPRAIVARNS